MNQQSKFNQTWYKLSLNEGKSSSLKKGSDPLQRGDNHKNVKMGWGYLKIFFSRTTGTWHKSSLGGGDSSLFK
jgi:hypothetical protein